MAAATSPALPLNANPDLSQNTITSVYPPVSLASHRLIRRGSRPMLSDGGFLLSSPASGTSPLLQMANEINTSLSATRKNKFRLLSDSSAKSASQNMDKRRSSATEGPISCHDLPDKSIKRISDNSHNLDNSANPKNNVVTTRRVSSILAPRVSSELDSQKASKFLQGMKSRVVDRRISTPEISANVAESERAQMLKSGRNMWPYDLQKEGNVHKIHSVSSELSLTINLETATMTSVNRSRVPESNIKTLSLTGEEVGSLSSETIFTEVSDSEGLKPRSFSMNDSKLDRNRKEKISKESTRKLSFDVKDKCQNYQHIENQRQETNTEVLTQKNKSKFLTDLYSGAEKIKKFINRGKAKKECKSMPLFRTSQSTTVYVKSGPTDVSKSLNEDKSMSDSRNDKAREHNLDVQSNETQHSLAEHPKCAQKSNLSSPTTHRPTSVSNWGCMTNTQSPEDKIESKNYPEKFISNNWKEGDGSSAVNNGNFFVMNESNYETSKFPLPLSVKFSSDQNNCPQHFPSEDDNNDVFSPAMTDNHYDQPCRYIRRYSFSDIYIPKLKLKKASSSSLGNPINASILRFNPLKIEPTRTDQFCRRLSLPNTSKEMRDLAAALARASAIHQKYSTRLLSADVHQKKARNSNVLQPLSEEIEQPLTIKHSQPVTSISDIKTTLPETKQAAIKSQNCLQNNISPSKEAGTDCKTSAPTVKRSMLTASFDESYSKNAHTSSRQTESLVVSPSEIADRNLPCQEAEVHLLHSLEKQTGQCFVDLPARNAVSLSDKVQVTESDKTYSHIDTCMLEAELSDMLYASDDVTERRRIRARIRDLRRHRPLIGGDSDVTLTSEIKQALVEHTTLSALAAVPGDSVSGEGVNTYEEIKNLSQLQKLLSEALDPADRSKIRNAIRKLRHRSQSEKLQTLKLATIKPDISAGQQQSHNSTRIGVDWKNPSSFAFPNETTSYYSASQQYKTIDGQPSQNEIIIDWPLSSSVNTETSEGASIIGTPTIVQSQSSFITPTVVPSQSSFSSDNIANSEYHESTFFASKGHSKNVSKSLTPNNDAPEALATVSESGSSEAENVSSVLEYVKERLKTRSESLTSASKTSDSSNSLYDNSSQPTSGNIFKLPTQTPERKISSSSIDKSRKWSLDRSSERASDKYREARNEILKFAKITLSDRDKGVPSGPVHSPLQSVHETHRTGEFSYESQVTLTTDVTPLPTGATREHAHDTKNSNTILLKKECPTITSVETSRDSKSEPVKEYILNNENTFVGDYDGREQYPSFQTREFNIPISPTIIQSCSTSPRVNNIRQRTGVQKLSLRTTSSDLVTFTTNTDLQKTTVPGETEIDRKYDSSIDIQKLETGTGLSKTWGLVSSLEAKPVQKGNQYSGIKVRRAQSLHSKVGNALPSNRSEVEIVLTRTLPESSSQGRSEGISRDSSAAAHNEQPKDHVRDAPQPSKPPRSLASPSSLFPTGVTKGSQGSDSKTIRQPGGVESKAKQVSLNKKNSVENVNLSPTALKRGKNLRRSLTESDITRPKTFTTRLEVQVLPNSGPQKESTSEPANETKLSKLGLTNNKSSHNPERKVILESQILGIHLSRAQLISSESPLDHPGTDLIKDTIDTIKSKLPSEPAKGKPHEQLSQKLPVTSISSPPPSVNTTVYCKQPTTTTMERAFSMLLEELDKISCSEGNPSDPDLSDGDDLLTLSSGSSGLDNSVDLSTTKWKSAYSPGDVSASGTRTMYNGGHVSGHFECDKRNQTNNEITVPHADLTMSGEENKSASVAKTSTQNFGSTTDSGIDLYIEEDGKPASCKDELRKESSPPTLLFTSSSPSSPLSSSPPASTLTTARARTLKYLGDSVLTPTSEMTGEQTIHETMNQFDSSDGYVSNNNVAQYSSEIAISDTTEPQGSAASFFGSRTFNIKREDDGTVTMHAVAEDHNQNKIVTVRTKTQRTPSNANEEMRDTIIEKTKLSPGGASVVERDVIQTKKRLTSRGSNYYTRSAYTTRTRRDRGSTETVEHSVSVETDNTSVSQGHSWGDKAVAQVILEDVNNANVLPASYSPTAEQLTTLASQNKDGHKSEGKHQTELYVTNIKHTGAQLAEKGRISDNGDSFNREITHKKDESRNRPVFVEGLTDLTVTEGHSTILSCTVTEADCVDWYKNGTLLKNGQDFKKTFDGREARLEIAEIFLDDMGEYSCVATNGAGEQRSICKLSVNACGVETVVVPMFLRKLPNMELSEGDTLVLECDVIGSPEPTLSWLKDGNQLGHSKSFSTSYDGRIACLQVSDVRIDDTGRYMCVAENPAGRVSLDASVTVKEKYRAPCFVSELQDSAVDFGGSIILQCEICGTPPPTIRWKKNGNLVQTSHNVVCSYINGIARLEIRQASGEDSACYECLASNSVSEVSCLCHVIVTGPKDVSKVTRRRVFQKLSEPRPADIISAAIQRASSHGVQRTQSFSPSSSTLNRDNFMSVPREENVFSEVHMPSSAVTVMHRPETLSITRESIKVTPRSDSVLTLSDSNIISFHGVSAPESDTPKTVTVSRTFSLKLPQLESDASTPSARLTSLSRSASMNLGRIIHPVPQKSQTPAETKTYWSPSSRDQPNQGEITTQSSLQEAVADLRSSNSIPEYRQVFISAADKKTLGPSPLSKTLSGSDVSSQEKSTEKIVREQEEGENARLSTFLSPTLKLSDNFPTLEMNGNSSISATSVPFTSLTAPSPSTQICKLPAGMSSELNQQTPQMKVSSSSVSAIRQQFLKKDQMVTIPAQNKPLGSSPGNIRRWQSLPPQESKPRVFLRKTAPNCNNFPAMPSYNEITDEEELHKLMNATEDFEERKKIRARLREIRDKIREESEAKRRQREAEAEDLVKKKFERAEEEKRKKLEAYKQQGPTHERDSKYHEVTQNLIQDKFKAAEEEKARKLAAYSSMATTKTTSDGGATTTTTSINIEKTPGGGTRTVTQKTTETKGFGGTSYGKPAEVTARELTERLMRSSGPGLIGRISVRTEAWNSTDGLVEKSEKSHSWGAKPQGAKSAMAAFKQMDNATNPDAAAKPNGLITVSLAKKAASTMKRNAVAIKQEILNFCKQNVAEYEGVEITNFSSSWNNGMAFCALIHHFFPNAFDFTKLDPKQRRYNFTLAFDTAEKEADIAPLLDVDDMVKMKNPDWKCVFTYVQSIYRHLKDHENNKAGPIEQ